MSLDYDALALQVSTLLEQLGRDMTFVFTAEPTVPSSMPWRDQEVETTASGHGVAVPPSSASQLGFTATNAEWVKRSEQIIIAYSATDISFCTKIVDSDGSEWRVQGVEKLQPAETRLLFFLGVVR